LCTLGVDGHTGSYLIPTPSVIGTPQPHSSLRKLCYEHFLCTTIHTHSCRFMAAYSSYHTTTTGSAHYIKHIVIICNYVSNHRKTATTVIAGPLPYPSTVEFYQKRCFVEIACICIWMGTWCNYLCVGRRVPPASSPAKVNISLSVTSYCI